MFDSHCHLDNARFDGDRDDVIARARAAGVDGMLLAGVDAADRVRQVALGQRHPDLALCFGVHPMVAAEVDDVTLAMELAWLRETLSARRPAALGETGLDRRSFLPAAGMPRQERAFREQITLAKEHGLPLVLHIVRAHDAAIRLLREEGVPAAGGVVHSYSGSAELVAPYVALGLHISFCGTVTFPDARKTRTACRVVPLDRLLVETDAPDQAPEPHRAERNEPAWLPRVIEAVAALRGEDPATVARVTADNARRLYGLASA